MVLEGVPISSVLMGSLPWDRCKIVLPTIVVRDIFAVQISLKQNLTRLYMFMGRRHLKPGQNSNVVKFSKAEEQVSVKQIFKYCHQLPSQPDLQTL